MKPLYFALILLFIALQYQLWWGDGSIREIKVLKSNLSMDQARIKSLKAHNYALSQQIKEIKHSNDEIENVAREEYNMVKDDEVYFQLVEKP